VSGFSASAFSTAAFSTNAFAFDTVASEFPLGGHFGFDEKKRKKQWDEEKQGKEKRALKLREALFGLPPAEREELTSAPIQTIEVAARDPIDYAVLMEKVRQLEFRIRLRRDEEEIAQLLEML
jgi:hypothetical protein